MSRSSDFEERRQASLATSKKQRESHDRMIEAVGAPESRAMTVDPQAAAPLNEDDGKSREQLISDLVDLRHLARTMLPVVAAAEAWFDAGRCSTESDALAKAVVMAKATAYVEMEER